MSTLQLAETSQTTAPVRTKNEPLFSLIGALDQPLYESRVDSKESGLIDTTDAKGKTSSSSKLANESGMKFKEAPSSNMHCLKELDYDDEEEELTMND